MGARNILVLARGALGTGLAHLQLALEPLRTWNAPLLVCRCAIVYALSGMPPRTRQQSLDAILSHPRRVLYHRHHHIIASARQPRWALFTRVLIRIHYVLRVQARVALLCVVRGCLLLVPCRATCEHVLVAGIIACRCSHPRAQDWVAAARASPVKRPERAHARAAYGPGGAVGTGKYSVVGSRLSEVKALSALARVWTCPSVQTSRVRTQGARKAVGMGPGLADGVVCI